MKKRKKDFKTLLLVDDVDLFLQLQISYLGYRRFDIHTAKSGSEALEKARDLKPDLILLDMFMPDMTGDAVCRILKEDPDTRSIPIIIASSGTRENSRKRCEAAGCDGLIYKPVRKDLLLSVVEKFLHITIRRYLRARVSLPATIIFKGDETHGTAHSLSDETHGTVHSLSADGAFVGIETGTIAGDLMEIRFNLPGIENEIFVRTAAVVWCGKLDEDGPKGAGIMFLSIYPEAADNIDTYVKRITEMKGTEEKMADDSDTGRVAPH